MNFDLAKCLNGTLVHVGASSVIIATTAGALSLYKDFDDLRNSLNIKVMALSHNRLTLDNLTVWHTDNNAAVLGFDSCIQLSARAAVMVELTYSLDFTLIALE